MQKKTIQPQSTERTTSGNRWLWLSLLVLLVIGILSTVTFLKITNLKMRGEILRQARILTKVLNIQQIQGLTGSPKDLETPAYLQLKEQLLNIKQLNEDFRFIYLMGRRADGQVFFFVDNEPAGSIDESPAGQIYEEVSTDYLRAFNEKKAIIAGPVTDRWGSWISALIPITDPHTGELIAVLGIDEDATRWQRNLLGRTALPVGLTLSLLIILATVAFISMGRIQASAQPIQRRLLIPLTLVLLLIGGGFILIQLKQQRTDLTLFSQRTLKGAVSSLEEELNHQTKSIDAMEEAILSSPELHEALAAKNREQLLTTWQPIYQKLKQTYGITHFYFHTASCTNLLRIHKPEKYGDFIDRHTLREAERTDQTSAGIELGPLGTFTLRVVRPIYYEYSLVGYLELGKEIEDILANMHANPEIEVMVSIHKHDLDQKQWEEGMAMLGRQADWNHCADSVQAYSSLNPSPSVCSWDAGSPKDAPFGVEIDDRPWQVLIHSLHDAEGDNVGNLVIMLNTHKERIALMRSWGTSIPVGLFILVALIAALYIVLHRTDASIMAQQAILLEQKKQLQLNSRRWEAAQQAAMAGNWEFDIQTNLYWASEEAFHVFGIPFDKNDSPNPHVIGRETLLVVVPTQSLERITQARTDLIKNNKPYDLIFEINHPDYSEARIIHSMAILEVDTHGNPIKVLGTIQDITALKKAEEENLELARKILQGEKHESLGGLAGGVAHDFNNILMAILGYTDLAISDLSETHPAQGSVLEIKKSALRAAALTQQMLAYSGKGHFVVTAMNISSLIDDMTHRIRTAVPKTIALNINLDKTLPSIKADITQLQQVVMNLITNASEAIGDVPGTLTLTTGQEECSEESLAKNRIHSTDPEEIAQPGSYLYFEIGDTGCGMDEEAQNKLFDPFFSTKFTGRGLGMAAVSGIVQGHSGAILIDTELGKGSIIRILFPLPK